MPSHISMLSNLRGERAQTHSVLLFFWVRRLRLCQQASLPLLCVYCSHRLCMSKYYPAIIPFVREGSICGLEKSLMDTFYSQKMQIYASQRQKKVGKIHYSRGFRSQQHFHPILQPWIYLFHVAFSNKCSEFDYVLIYWNIQTTADSAKQ